MAAVRSWEFCTDEPEISRMSHSFVIAPLSLMAAVAITVMTILYIKRLKNATNKNMYNSGILFFVLSIVIELVWVACSIFYCRDLTVYMVLYTTTCMLYAVQYDLVLLLMYQRLKYIFGDTEYRISAATNTCFVVVLCVATPFTILVAFVYANSASMQAFATAVFISVTTLLSGFLTALFVSKLRRVYINNRDSRRSSDNSEMVRLIIKTSSLAFASILFSVLTIPFYLSIELTPSIHLWIGASVIMVSDVFVNFMCLWLSYSAFEAYYRTLCVVCDVQCFSFWKKVSGNDVKQLSYVVSRSNMPETSLNSAVSIPSVKKTGLV